MGRHDEMVGGARRWLYRLGGQLRPESPLAFVAMRAWRLLVRVGS